MPRFLVGAFCAFLLCSTCFGDDLDKIIAKGRLVVWMRDIDLPPFLMSGADGKPCGYDVELAKGAAAELGVELVIERKATTFNELIDAVHEGRADMALSKLSRTLLRARKTLFSDPYIVMRKALLVNRLELARRRGSTPMEAYIRNINGSLGVLAGSSYVDFAGSMFPKARMREYKNWSSIVADVDDGKLLCGFRDELEVKRAMRMTPGASLNLLSVVFNDTEDPIAIAIPPDAFRFRLWLNDFIEDRKLRTSVDKLLSRYSSCMFEPAPAKSVATGPAAGGLK